MTLSETPLRRALWRNVHLWVGVVLFLVFAPLGVSGSLLVWDDAIDQAQHPQRYAVGQGALPPADYLAAATKAFAGRAIPAQIRLPREAGQPVTVVGYRSVPAQPGQRPPSLTAWIDPASGRVLDVGDPRQDLRGVIHRLHGNLMLPQSGRPVVGWLGVAMLISSLTGLIIWWPRGGFLKGLRWRRSPSAFSNLHHLTGVIVCIPLAVLSFTGAYIAFPGLFGPSAGPARDGGRNHFEAPLPAPHTNIAAALAAAQASAPAGARPTSIQLPTSGRGPAWRIQYGAGEHAVTVRVDDAKGMVRPQRARDPAGRREGEGGDPFARLMRGLHDGSGLGVVWKVIIALTGLAPALLGVTGTVIWASRKLRTQPVS